MSAGERSRTTGRLLTGLVWVAVLLWLWGGGPAGVRLGPSGPTTGDVAAAGRPPREPLPPAAAPLGDAPPRRLEIPDLDVRASVVTRALDRRGAAPAPQPPSPPGAVAWHGAGPAPGAAGTALMAGQAGTGAGLAALHGIGTLRPGASIRVVRGDGAVADFTVEDVTVLPGDPPDVRQASYGPAPRQPDRAELRIVMPGATSDRASRNRTASVVVSAYLTGTAR
ncbi:class F sortase [Streptomyces sp. NPDC046831]|uniref:class F sortase n=1 Tax=Streptomyces sp. NPDC046831 TaxID=3154805 RepID=UPI0033C1CDF6